MFQAATSKMSASDFESWDLQYVERINACLFEGYREGEWREKITMTGIKFGGVESKYMEDKKNYRMKITWHVWLQTARNEKARRE